MKANATMAAGALVAGLFAGGTSSAAKLDVPTQRERLRGLRARGALIAEEYHRAEQNRLAAGR